MDKDQQANSVRCPNNDSGASEEIEKYFERYGPLMQGRDVWRALGYPSQDAFGMARRRGTIPVNLFQVPGRRGVFAYTADVARWVATIRLQGAATNPKEEGPQ